MKYSSLILSTVLLASPLTFADYYVDLRADISSGSGTQSIDSEDFDIDYSGYSLMGTGYFGKVTTENVPLQEAGFLSKKSSLSLIKASLDADFEFGDLTHEILALSGRAVIPHANVIISGGRVKIEDGLDFGIDVDTQYLELGAYLSDINSLVLRYTDYDFDGSLEGSALGIYFYQVNKVGSVSHIAWNLGVEKISYEFGSNFEEDDLAFEGGLTFYVNNQLGIGANLSTVVIDSDDYEGAQSTFLPYITYDFNEVVGIYFNTASSAFLLEYDEGFDSEEYDYEETSLIYTLGVNIRI